MPQIYVACLAAYNAGRLHGKWIDATQDADAIHEQIAEVLKSSPIAGAEEWAIHDYDDLPFGLGEYEDIDTVSRLAQAYEQHGAPFAAWMDTRDDPRSVDPDEFEQHYRGEWSSEEDYAWEVVKECGWAGVQFVTYEPTEGYDYTGRSKVNPLDALESYLDMETIAQELFQHGNYTSRPAPGGQVWVFEDEV